MADQELTFHSWWRERLADLATTTEAGRARGSAPVTLTGTDAGGATTTTATRTVGFLLAGPADVVGLKAGAISGRYPAPGAGDHESDRCAHVELRDPALPWRYSPAGNPGPGGHLHPWLALVVGIEGEELVLADDRVAVSPAVQALHPLAGAGAHPWAHVQVDAEGRRVARVLSGRPLEAGTDYVAVLVPAFQPDGSPAWTGAAPVTLPVYDRWRFRTATPAGSFEDLAARLQPGQADPTTGRAPVDYPRVPAAGDLEVRGALAPLGEGDAPLPAEIGTDLAGLRTPVTDEVGRPIVGLPRYGDAWVPDPDATTWGAELNGDPRTRGVAGLGLELGIRLQEELAAEASAAVGALAEARQRIAHLGLGLAASGALWERRLPVDPMRRLWVLGPALRRVATDAGTVADLATAPDRSLPAGLFSTAVRRALRPGPARTRLLDGGPPDPAAVLVAANRCPDPPKPRDDGLAVDVGYEDLEERRRRAVETGELDLGALLDAAEDLAGRGHPGLKDFGGRVVVRLRGSVDAGRRAPWLDALGFLIATTRARDEDVERLTSEFFRLMELWDQLGIPSGELGDVLESVGEPEPEEPPCRPVDLDGLAQGVDEAFDPRGPDGPVRVRVLDTIDGLDPAQPLAPPEVCIGLDRPVWIDVEAAFEEWLLPGVGRLPQDAVIAVETNPLFVDALLTGMNTQLLAELRWRGIPVATGCTPLRVFWDRADADGDGDRVDDVRGLHAWPADSALGAPSHRPDPAAGRDLVVVVRGELFRRYPATVVYLVTAVHAAGAEPDWDADPPAGALRRYPSFQGRIGADVTFFGFQGLPPEDVAHHWVVFEEPPAGYRFANDVVLAPFGMDGATFARQAFANPVRVLIQGDALDPEGP